MLTKEQEPTEPWGESNEFDEPLRTVMRFFYIGGWAIALLCLCATEAIVFHGQWFRPQPHLTTARLFTITSKVMLPGFLGLVMLFLIGKMSKVGQISLTAAAILKLTLGILLAFVYIALLDFADIAFY
jgi:hypothetical protein